MRPKDAQQQYDEKLKERVKGLVDPTPEQRQAQDELLAALPEMSGLPPSGGRSSSLADRIAELPDRVAEKHGVSRERAIELIKDFGG